MTDGHGPADRFSVCEHVLRLGDVRLDIEAALAAGATGFSPNADDFGGIGLAEAARLLDGAGLTVTSYIDPAVMRLGPEVPDFDRIARAAAAAAELGAPAMLFIAGALDDRRIEAADRQVVDTLGQIGERLAGTGVRPMLEPLHPIAREFSYVHTIRHALDLVQHVEGAGIVVDLGASWWERDLVDDVASHLESVITVQITGVRADELAQRRYVREQCAVVGDVPVGDLVRDLVDAGYAGWFEHEVLAPHPHDRRVSLLGEDRHWFASLWDD